MISPSVKVTTFILVILVSGVAIYLSTALLGNTNTIGLATRGSLSTASTGTSSGGSTNNAATLTCPTTPLEQKISCGSGNKTGTAAQAAQLAKDAKAACVADCSAKVEAAKKACDAYCINARIRFNGLGYPVWCETVEDESGMDWGLFQSGANCKPTCKSDSKANTAKCSAGDSGRYDCECEENTYYWGEPDDKTDTSSGSSSSSSESGTS